jgi:hypothetical protein
MFLVGSPQKTSADNESRRRSRAVPVRTRRGSRRTHTPFRAKTSRGSPPKHPRFRGSDWPNPGPISPTDVALRGFSASSTACKQRALRARWPFGGLSRSSQTVAYPCPLERIRRALKAVRLLASDGRIPRPLRWLAVVSLLPIPGPVDEGVLLLVACLLWLFYRDRLKDAWTRAA